MAVKDRKETVVITGASAGIGRAVAREFAKHGARIGLLARGIDGLEAAKADVEKLGGEAVPCVCDVSDYDQVEEAAQKVEDAFGPIDVWINNATTTVFAPVHEYTPDEFKRVVDVTLMGQIYGAMVALKRMRPRDRGMIVFVGSALAYRGIPLQSAYCASKHGIEGFYDSLRTELLHDNSGVKATIVQLPGVNTPQFDWNRNKLPMKPRPLGAVYQPEVAAQAIYWAAHNDRRELIVGMPAVQAIVGNKFVPGYADKVLAEHGFAGQLRDEPVERDHRDNLFEPLPGDWGAHGSFDHEARAFSPQLWATTHRKALAALGLGAVGLVGAAAVLGRGRGHGNGKC